MRVASYARCTAEVREHLTDKGVELVFVDCMLCSRHVRFSCGLASAMNRSCRDSGRLLRYSGAVRASCCGKWGCGAMFRVSRNTPLALGTGLIENPASRARWRTGALLAPVSAVRRVTPAEAACPIGEI